MKYEVYEDLRDPRSWRVEGFDDQAGIIALFSLAQRHVNERKSMPRGNPNND